MVSQAATRLGRALPDQLPARSTAELPSAPMTPALPPSGPRPPASGPYDPAVDLRTAESLVAIAEDARAGIRREDPEAAAAIEVRYADMLEVLEWSLAAGQPDTGFRLAAALVPFWMSTKRIDDGDAWFRRALAQPAGSTARRARASHDHGYLLFFSGHYDEADPRFAESRALAETAGDANLVALALAGAARVALGRDPHEAVRLTRDAVAATDGTPPGDGRSSALHVLGVALQMTGDLQGARDVMTARLELGRAEGNEFVVWVESANLSMVERQLGNFDHAERLSRNALSIARARGDAMAIPWIINGLAAVTAAKGQLERAATLNGMAAAMLERAGGEWPPDELEQYEETLAAVDKGLPPAVIERARAKGAAMSTPEGVDFALAPTPA
jgi:tetratricopeptide (TPR) repeat protein